MGNVEEQGSRQGGDHAAGTALVFLAPLSGLVAGNAMDLGFAALLALVLGVSVVSVVRHYRCDLRLAAAELEEALEEALGLGEGGHEFGISCGAITKACS